MTAPSGRANGGQADTLTAMSPTHEARERAARRRDELVDVLRSRRTVPSQRELADLLGVSVGMIGKDLDALEKAGRVRRGSPRLARSLEVVDPPAERG